MIKNNVKKYREKFNVSQKELSEELNTTKQYVSKLELGKTLPSIDVCYRVKNALENITLKKSNGNQVINLRIEDLFYEDGELN
jgi:Predicted transcriptional regulator